MTVGDAIRLKMRVSNIDHCAAVRVSGRHMVYGLTDPQLGNEFVGQSIELIEPVTLAEQITAEWVACREISWGRA